MAVEVPRVADTAVAQQILYQLGMEVPDSGRVATEWRRSWKWIAGVAPRLDTQRPGQPQLEQAEGGTNGAEGPSLRSASRRRCITHGREPPTGSDKQPLLELAR